MALKEREQILNCVGEERQKAIATLMMKLVPFPVSSVVQSDNLPVHKPKKVAKELQKNNFQKRVASDLFPTSYPVLLWFWLQDYKSKTERSVISP